MGVAGEALRIYREQGAHALSYRASDFVRYRLRDLTDAVFGVYWDRRGERQVISIDGVSATFDAQSKRGGPTVRRHATTERKMVADMIANLRDDDVMYDIGANVGFHSAFGAKCGSTVYAFEPYPPNFRQLNRNLSYNSSDVGAFEIALSDDNGETKFAAPSSTVGYGTGRIGGGKRVVETRRGDDFIQEHGLETPDVIKIDVEGAEAAVIDGMSDTLQGSRRIYVELHLPADHRSSSTSTDRSPADLLCDLRDREFNVQILSNRGDEIQIVAERQ